MLQRKGMLKRNFWWIVVIVFMLSQTAFAEGINLETTYPYSLDHKNIHKTVGSATNPLYINIESYDAPDPQDVDVEIILPEGLLCNDDADWQKIKTDQGLVIKRNWLLPANYGQNFDLLYLRASEELAEGKHDIVVKVSGKSWQKNNVITFVHELGAKSEEVIDQPTKQLDKSKFNWYIQSITLPVDNLGNKDDRMQDGTIYIKDTALESFRNRMTGDGATNWAAVFNHPAAHILLEMRNPQQDTRILKFRAELIDKATGRPAVGLCTASQSDSETEHGWGGQAGSEDASTAMISLDGKKIKLLFCRCI